MRFVRVPVIAVALALAGCSSDGGAGAVSASVTSVTPAPTVTPVALTSPVAVTSPVTEAPVTEAPVTTLEAATTTDDLTADRPFKVFVPTSYDEATAVPLVVLLHGYSASGDGQEAYFQLQPLAEERGFLYVHPDGLKDPTGNQFWNATDACCQFASARVDDSAYLMSVIDHVEATYNVDPRRIFVLGHSNGGFMSYRMACDHADKIAAIASLAGATFADPAACRPSEPVSVLQIHGTADKTISYTGASIAGHAYPAAANTVATWAAYDGCTATAPIDAGGHLDLEGGIDGAETSVATFAGCPTGVDVELWTMGGAPHIPSINAAFAPDVIDFLLAHPKPG